MIQWPLRAKAAIRKLFEPLQDVDVYVEDTNDEVFYRTLLNKIAEGKVHVARVIALGGKIAVIEAARNHNFTKRRALFLIDGDLDWVRGVKQPQIIGLHQHKAYCIENLLLCEKALSFVLSQEAIISEEDAKIALDFKSWVNSIQQPLVELFAAFGVAKEISPEITTVSKGVGIMCTTIKNPKSTFLDIVKVNREKTAILSAIKTNSSQEHVMDVYSQILQRLNSLSFPLHGVSGKDFMLPLADFLLQSHGCRIKRRSLRIRLATAGDLNRFSSLCEALLNAARGCV